MDFDDSPEEAEYRAHVRGLLEQHAGELLHVAPGESIDPADPPGGVPGDRAGARRGRAGRHPVAARARRPGRHAGAAGDRRAGVRPRPHPHADQPHRHRHVRPDRHRPRQRRPEAALPRPAAARRRRLVPAVQRAGVRLRPRRRCAPPPSATATTGSSTARRSGRRWRTSPTTASCSPAPTPTARSTPGLTMFVVDMHAPGVTVRPLRQMAGGSGFNEVFFDDVRIPDSERLGEPGEGWRVALTTLMNERVAIGGAGSDLGVPVETLAAHARDRLPRLPEAKQPVRPAGGRPGGRRAAGHPLHRLPAVHRAQPGRPARARGRRRQARRHGGRAAGRRRGRAAARRRRGLRARPPTATTPGSAPRPTCPGWRSPAAPTRCCATSSANGCSACRRNRAPTSRGRSREARDELRPRHRPARRRRRGAPVLHRVGLAGRRPGRARGRRGRAGAQGAGRDRLPRHHGRRGRRRGRAARCSTSPSSPSRAARCWPARRW